MFAAADLVDDDIPPPSEEPVWEDDFGLHLGESPLRSIADVQTILFHLLDPFHDLTPCPIFTLRPIRPSCPLFPHQSPPLPLVVLQTCIPRLAFRIL
jgi:hypothetical protein